MLRSSMKLNLDPFVDFKHSFAFYFSHPVLTIFQVCARQVPLVQGAKQNL